MRLQKRFFLSITLFLFVLLLLSGCDKNNTTILEPDVAMVQNVDKLNFISLDLGADALAKRRKPIIISTTVTPKHGGMLTRFLDGANRTDERFADMWGKVTLEFPAWAVDKKVNVSFKLMRGFFMGFVELEYSPHGLVFNRPAILNICGKNLDLSSIDQARVDDIKLYYTSQLDGVWREMNCKEIFIDVENGIFRVIDGKLPHFSRYAVAYSD